MKPSDLAWYIFDYSIPKLRNLLQIFKIMNNNGIRNSYIYSFELWSKLSFLFSFQLRITTPKIWPTLRRRFWRGATSTRTEKSPRRSWPWSCSPSQSRARKIKEEKNGFITKSTDRACLFSYQLSSSSFFIFLTWRPIVKSWPQVARRLKLKLNAFTFKKNVQLTFFNR